MAKIISLHSFGRGTGKSCLAANLAALLAVDGRKVGVVDADLASPSQQALWGLDERAALHTLNSYLWGQCDIGATLFDLTPRLALDGPGRLHLVPASQHSDDIARALRGAQVHPLHEALDQLSGRPEADLWLVDTHAGLTEETLQAFAASDELLAVLQHDQRDYQGTAVTLDVARKLGVPRVTVLLNQLPATFDPVEAKHRVAETYQCEVVGVLPYASEQAEFGSSGFFAWRHPTHALTAVLRQVAATLAGQIDHGELWQVVEGLPMVEGLGPMEMLSLPAAVGGVLRAVASAGGLTSDRLAAALQIEADEAQRLCVRLAQKGYLAVEAPEPPSPEFYRVRLARTRKRNIPLDL